jgi:dTMP kinase
VIRPALEGGALVLCDRFADSTVAYQHYGHGVERAVVDAVNDFATGGLQPDLTVLLDIEPRAARGRGAGEHDYLEREGADFHEQVRQGYLALARGAPERWLVLDAARPAEELSFHIWQRISALMQSAG